MTNILEIEGMGETYANKLKNVGIPTVEMLLDAGCEPEGRKSLAEKTGISDALILKWVNHADLMRVKGIGSEYADLLEAAGVDTIVELSKRVPANLVKKMEEVNAAKKLVRKLPVESQVTDWVGQAKQLGRKVNY